MCKSNFISQGSKIATFMVIGQDSGHKDNRTRTLLRNENTMVNKTPKGKAEQILTLGIFPISN